MNHVLFKSSYFQNIIFVGYCNFKFQSFNISNCIISKMSKFQTKAHHTVLCSSFQHFKNNYPNAYDIHTFMCSLVLLQISNKQATHTHQNMLKHKTLKNNLPSKLSTFQNVSCFVISKLFNFRILYVRTFKRSKFKIHKYTNKTKLTIS